jgi:hypothetical protein
MEDTVTNNMRNKPRLKRTLAREILLFFAGLGLIGLAWSFLLTRNSYYENNVNSYSYKIKSLQIQLEGLPKDYIKEFYDKASRYFVVNYRLGQDSYAIPKEQEQTFLYDELGVKKNVTLLPINSKGYSYFHTDIFKEYGGHELNPKRTPHFEGSTIVIDFVPYAKFRELITSKDYQEKLFSVFSSSPYQDGKVKVNSLIEIPKFDPMKPYKGIFDLGTLSEFKSKMSTGLQYNQTVIEEKNKIETDIQRQRKLISSSKNSLLTSDEIHSFLINILIAIGMLLYPVRLSILLILWAFKTMKQKQ